jgi:hypothetical protein
MIWVVEYARIGSKRATRFGAAALLCWSASAVFHGLETGNGGLGWLSRLGLLIVGLRLMEAVVRVFWLIAEELGRVLASLLRRTNRY